MAATTAMLLTFFASTATIDVPTTELPARCRPNYCAELTENVCTQLPPNCTSTSLDFFGWETLSPDACNCCPYCIAYLGLNEVCPIGEATGIVPTHMCGPGLYCVGDPDTMEPKCMKMVDVVALDKIPSGPPQFNVDCSLDQLKYDQAVESGTVGNLQVRPDCDGNGFYVPSKCVPGEICYCQDEHGNRIFGEIPFTPLASKTMHCGCSRHNTKATRQLKDLANTWSQMRCLSDGSFDPIQCLDQGCLCVDRLDGVPTYPGRDLVNASDIAPGTIDCFDKHTHIENDYYNVCEDSFIRNYMDDLEFKLEGYDLYGAGYVSCQMDGNFAPIQRNDKEVFCADPDGDKIENYGVPHGDTAAANMNCNCARANLLISGLERPECCPNGNYKRMQCRRGECRCVDENGNQIEKEVPEDDAERLNCFKNKC